MGREVWREGGREEGRAQEDLDLDWTFESDTADD